MNMMIKMKDGDDFTLMISSACLAWASLTPSKPFLAFRWVQHTVTLFFVALEIMIKIIIINVIVIMRRMLSPMFQLAHEESASGWCPT